MGKAPEFPDRYPSYSPTLAALHLAAAGCGAVTAVDAGKVTIGGPCVLRGDLPMCTVSYGAGFKTYGYRIEHDTGNQATTTNESKLKGFHLTMLQAVIATRRRGKALNGAIAHPLRRRGLVFVSNSCAHGCCRWYRATPAGYRAAGKPVPKRWR